MPRPSARLRLLTTASLLAAACTSSSSSPSSPPQPVASASSPKPSPSPSASARHAASSASAAPPPSASAAASAARPAAPPSTAITLALAARHEGFRDARRVGSRLVLVGCHKLRILDTDLEKGRDVPAPDVSDKGCRPLVAGVADGALVLRGKAPRAVDIETGKTHALAANAAPSADGAPDEGASYDSGDAGVTRLVRHPRTEWHVWQLVTGKDALYSYGPDGLVRAADPRTLEVVWEYGTGLDVQGEGMNTPVPVLWTLNGEEILVASGRSAAGHDGILLFHHGAAATPLWVGTVHGQVKGATGEGDHVHAAGHTATTDKAGVYSLDVATRGTLLVVGDACGAGCDLSTEAVELQPGHGPYKVDLTVSVHDQACR